MAPNAPRPFTTSARVHPAIPVSFHQPHHHLPKMTSPAQSTARLGRWFLPVTGLLFLGAAATSYLDRRFVQGSYTPGLSATEQRALRQREQNAALMSAYGDRESLEDVQRAMELYEVQ
ncbi:set domain protein [Diplodia corticola]|uniref:Set domain protein n=1 Tax=Diplodia corticola TaxID=236234 RepID=A0A1J9QMY2_9PEZI|nr:set domain protein [Diplodia corticola]OJD30246.1 set domain protein [Diplodia corticola]